MLYGLEIAPAVTLNASNIALFLQEVDVHFIFWKAKAERYFRGKKKEGDLSCYVVANKLLPPHEARNSPKYKVRLKTVRS